MIKQGTILQSNYITSRLVGRTGNMMFQLAHGLVKSIKYNRQFVAPSLDSSSQHLEDNLFKKINFLPFKTDKLLNVKHIGCTFEYSQAIPDDNLPTVFTGWFQSEKFFEGYTEFIKDVFSPPLEFISNVLLDYPFINNTIVAAINIRRGDYLTQPTRHPVLSLDYIKEAYKNLPYHDYLLIMSDDMEWCRQNIDLPKSIFVDTNKYWDEKGIWLLSLCDHFVISNSTFSWWGAWLSRTPDKTVIAPSTWFGPDIKENTNDIFCENWIKVPSYFSEGKILPL